MNDKVLAQLQQELQARAAQVHNADPQCSYLRGAIAALEGRLPGQQGAEPELEVIEPQQEGGTLG